MATVLDFYYVVLGAHYKLMQKYCTSLSYIVFVWWCSMSGENAHLRYLGRGNI